MSFYNRIEKYKNVHFQEFWENLSDHRIENVLRKDRLNSYDFLSLLSPAAEQFLEQMAQRAHQLTKQHFGKTVILYTPMYLSNYCTNQCLYCGFNKANSIERKQMTVEEVEKEAEIISNTGIKHILLLTGDAPKIATIQYLKECIRAVKNYFTSINIELYAMETREYHALLNEGVDSLTIYQETYNRELYYSIHVSGPKKDYVYRLEAPERACAATMRSVNIGALLGLDDFRRETFFTGIHAAYLQDSFPEVEFSVSLPRMRPHVGKFQSVHPVSDKHIVQLMAALRLFLPRVGMTVSTRESSVFRDNILRLGVTKMSAGSKTSVGGHSLNIDQTGQFDISDHRTVDEMKRKILELGYQPVFQDWRPITTGNQRFIE